MKRLFVVTALSVIVFANLFAQQPNIENLVALVERGEGATVQMELPSLLKQNPNNAGLLYVQALLTTDGAEAARLYQNIVDTHPKSEWADDALHKVYKFYQAIGLYRTAEIKLSQLRANYPNSKYVNDGAVAETKTETQPEPKTVETPKTTETPKETTPKPIETPVKETKTPEVAAGKFTLQVGVYSTRANANRQKQFFEYQKLSAEIVTRTRGDKELFAVLVGSFATTEEAKTKSEDIKRSFNIESIVVTR